GNERADQVSAHMVDEGVGLDVDDDLAAAAADRKLVNSPHRRPRLATHRPEAGEIMLAQQRLPGFVHAFRIERLAYPGNPATVDGRPHPAVENAIAIVPP